MAKHYKVKNGLTQLQAIKSVRVTWAFSPVTRVTINKKVYSRKNVKYEN